MQMETETVAAAATAAPGDGGQQPHTNCKTKKACLSPLASVAPPTDVPSPVGAAQAADAATSGAAAEGAAGDNREQTAKRLRLSCERDMYETKDKQPAGASPTEGAFLGGGLQKSPSPVAAAETLPNVGWQQQQQQAQVEQQLQQVNEAARIDGDCSEGGVSGCASTAAFSGGTAPAGGPPAAASAAEPQPQFEGVHMGVFFGCGGDSDANSRSSIVCPDRFPCSAQQLSSSSWGRRTPPYSQGPQRAAPATSGCTRALGRSTDVSESRVPHVGPPAESGSEGGVPGYCIGPTGDAFEGPLWPALEGEAAAGAVAAAAAALETSPVDFRAGYVPNGTEVATAAGAAPAAAAEPIAPLEVEEVGHLTVSGQMAGRDVRVGSSTSEVSGGAAGAAGAADAADAAEAAEAADAVETADAAETANAPAGGGSATGEPVAEDLSRAPFSSSTAGTPSSAAVASSSIAAAQDPASSTRNQQPLASEVCEESVSSGALRSSTESSSSSSSSSSRSNTVLMTDGLVGEVNEVIDLSASEAADSDAADDVSVVYVSTDAACLDRGSAGGSTPQGALGGPASAAAAAAVATATATAAAAAATTAAAAATAQAAVVLDSDDDDVVELPCHHAAPPTTYAPPSYLWRSSLGLQPYGAGPLQLLPYPRPTLVAEDREDEEDSAASAALPRCPICLKKYRQQQQLQQEQQQQQQQAAGSGENTEQKPAERGQGDNCDSPAGDAAQRGGPGNSGGQSSVIQQQQPHQAQSQAWQQQQQLLAARTSFGMSAQPESDHVVALRCGHVFCKTCILAALRTRRQCPVCRVVLKGSKPYQRIFL